MIKVKFTIVTLFLSSIVFSQCLTYDQLSGLTKMNLEQRDSILSKNGFILSNSDETLIELFGVEWHNAKTDQYVQIKNTGTTFNQLTYRLKSTEICYDNIKKEIINMGVRLQTNVNFHS